MYTISLVANKHADFAEDFSYFQGNKNVCSQRLEITYVLPKKAIKLTNIFPGDANQSV